MIEVHVYGHLKKKFNPNASLAEDTVIKKPYVKDESFQAFLRRLDLSSTDYGECFLNHKVVTDQATTLIPEGSRVAIFSNGMYLIDGGQYLKGHGYIMKKPSKKVNWY
ncbi:MAG: hypothetical protein ACXAEU_19735 [Candidatus Hodarchaeales archaeon]